MSARDGVDVLTMIARAMPWCSDSSQRDLRRVRIVVQRLMASAEAAEQELSRWGRSRVVSLSSAAKARMRLFASLEACGDVPDYENVHCETCDGIGTIDETLGGISTSNPAAKCPDCDGVGQSVIAVRTATKQPHDPHSASEVDHG